MTIIEAIIFGIAQGLSEFIPISSSGHLVLLHNVLGSEGSLAFDVALHGATLLALICFFYKDIAKLIKAFFVQSDQTKLARLLAVASIPAVIAGTLLEDMAESSFRSVMLVAINLIVIALFMLWAEKLYSIQKNRTTIKKIKTNQALWVGVAQALAVVPGVSRSGSTITTGLFVGLDRVSATRFSFLLGIPIISGALLKVGLDGGLEQVSSEPVLFIAGGLAAFISGLFAIGFMLKFLVNHTLALFAYYRIALGLLIFIVLALQ